MRLAALAFFVPALCLAQTQELPRLVVEPPQHDFGKLAPDTRATHRFTLSNTGNAPLVIGPVNASCGCTSTVVGKTTLAPGESTELEVTLSTVGLQGAVRRTVQILSNDPIDASQTVAIEAEVLADVTPSTTTVLFQDLRPGDRRKASVKLASGTSQTIVLGGVDLSPAPWLGVATREAGRDLFVDFDLLARRLPPGRLYGTDTVALHLTNPRPSVVNLSVRWELRAPVRATPERVAWAEAAGRELLQSVRLESRARKPFRILSARTSNPLLEVRGLAPGAAATQTVQLLFSAAAAPGIYDEKAFLTLDGPGHPEFVIRVAAALR